MDSNKNHNLSYSVKIFKLMQCKTEQLTAKMPKRKIFDDPAEDEWYIYRLQYSGVKE